MKEINKFINDLISKFLRKERNKGKYQAGNNESQVELGNAPELNTDQAEEVNTYATPKVDQNKISNKSVRLKQQSYLLLILAGVMFALFGLASFMQNKKEQKTASPQRPSEEIKIEVASDNVSPYQMLYENFDKKYKNAEKNYSNSVIKLEEESRVREQNILAETKQEMSKLGEQLKFIALELKSTNSELREAKKELEEKKNDKNEVETSALSSRALGGETIYDVPKSTKNYIPENTFLNGYLREGIRVSSSESTVNDPKSLTIMITDNGNLPKNFAHELKYCTISASAYGDASSESANIRLEKLVCTDPKTQLVTETQIIGSINGPDGMNGIRGTIVDTGLLQVRNAAAIGFLDGFVNAAKGQQSMSVTPFGSINTNKQSMGDVLKDSGLSGASSGMNELTKYYIRKAESLAPTIEIPGGVRVQATFRSGVFYGELGTHKKVKDLRKENKRKIEQENEQAYE